MRFILALIVVFPAIYAYNAFHVYENVSLAQFQCLVETKVSYSLVRIYNSSPKPDPFGATNIQSAWDAGMKKVDGYVVPNCGTGYPAEQVIYSNRTRILVSVRFI
jgi:uncharacterized protein YxeA